MKFNNTKSKTKVAFIYFFLSISVLLTTMRLCTFTKDFNMGKMWYFLPVAIVIIIIFMYCNAKFFEFDGEGSALTFINKGLLISNLINYREKRVEFPKDKLQSYKIHNYIIYTSISIYIKSKNNRVVRRNFNISFLSLKQKKVLKKALDNILRS